MLGVKSQGLKSAFSSCYFTKVAIALSLLALLRFFLVFLLLFFNICQ
jgi:hypothetical protein